MLAKWFIAVSHVRLCGRGDITSNFQASKCYNPPMLEEGGTKRSFLNRPVVWLVSALIIVLFSGAYFYLNGRDMNPVPLNIKASVNFPLYYPVKLPAGYSIKKDSFSSTPQVVTYYAENHRGERMLFSIQAPPDSVGVNDFNKRVLQNQIQIISDAGQARLGDINGRITGSLVTKKSWVLLTASSDKVPKKVMADALSSLQQD
jgi:hypothetical protein